MQGELTSGQLKNMEARNGPAKTAAGVGPLHRRLLSRLPQRSSQAERVAVLIASGALFAGTFALGFAVSDPGESAAVLFTLPIVLTAVKFGMWGGIGAAGLTMALLGVWDLAGQDHMPLLSYVGRTGAYLLLGGLLGSFSTRLRASHERVRRREAQLDAILDNSTAVIWLKDRKGRYMLINRRFEDVFHVRRESVVGKTDHDVFPVYLADGFRANDKRVLRDRRVLELEEQVSQSGDGDLAFITVKFPLFDSTGEPYGVCGISTDITSRKRAEEELKQSKDRIGQIIDRALDGFISMDQDGVVTSWNRSAEQIFGWPAKKAIGLRLSELIVPERYRSAHERGLQRFLETGKGPLLDKHVELLATHRDGHEFPVELSITAVKVRGGFAFHAFVHDITDRKRLEREILRLTELPAATVKE
jgi:PAS domain S-box-containing protein